MAESVESRKFERKAVFDIPLPMKRAPRDTAVDTPAPAPAPAPTPAPAATPAQPSGNTMAFSLMTKKGNKQQTRTIDLPSDSTFAVAMRSQQQADREEQQRIKNLVLNYEMTTEAENTEGELLQFALYFREAKKSRNRRETLRHSNRQIWRKPIS